MPRPRPLQVAFGPQAPANGLHRIEQTLSLNVLRLNSRFTAHLLGGQKPDS
jgi:hypothetical protein